HLDPLLGVLVNQVLGYPMLAPEELTRFQECLVVYCEYCKFVAPLSQGALRRTFVCDCEIDLDLVTIGVGDRSHIVCAQGTGQIGGCNAQLGCCYIGIIRYISKSDHCTNKQREHDYQG